MERHCCFMTGAAIGELQNFISFFTNRLYDDDDGCMIEVCVERVL